MSPFDLREPRTLREALRLLDAEDPSVRPLGGGTALMLMMKAGVFTPTRLVSLHRLGEKHSRVRKAQDGTIRIGALATLSALERSPLIQRSLPVVAQTLVNLSNVRVRNVATIGGNLAHADPHMDLPPVLMALGATVHTASPSGERDLPLDALFSGYYETVLARNELITEVAVPAQGARAAAYLKVTTRSADDWPALGVAAVLDMEGETVREARIVASAAIEKATRLTGVEDLLTGAHIDDALLARAGEAACEAVSVIPDAQGSAPYKRELLRVYIGRAVREALACRKAQDRMRAR
jgi:aerobic carbon-monoxide dehydrogenase medium subunit